MAGGKANGHTSAASSSSLSNNNKKQQQQQSKAEESSAAMDFNVLQAVLAVGLLNMLFGICREAYTIRLYAILEYGRVIHEFDPYFNYRATEYLYEHGWKKFCTWFDYLVWYPLGRPVGTTIYPGMQVTSVFIKNYILPDWSINDICCFVPAWFGVLATLAVGFLTYECTRLPSAPEKKKKDTEQQQDDGDNDAPHYESALNAIPIVRHIYRGLLKPAVNFMLTGAVLPVTKSTWGLHPHVPKGGTSWVTPALCSVFASALMSVVPAHLSRSIGGGYDNESIAMTAMVLTFACWTRALRDRVSIAKTCTWGVLTGLAYFYMAAAWGGYVFVLNMVGFHAGILVLLGRFSSKLHAAYTSFYIVGTALAIQVPVVGWTPLKSVEQLAPFGLFGMMQLLYICNELQKRKESGKTYKMRPKEIWAIRFKVFGAAGVAALAVVLMLAPTGYFGPISSRVRGLFVKHTKTGNPLVDSVAEHQAASPQAYFQYLNVLVYIAPIGFLMTAACFFNDSSSFLLIYAVTTYFLSHKMVRLVLLTAPVASSLAGVAIGRLTGWGVQAIFGIIQHSKVAGKKSEKKAPDPAEPEEKKKGGKGKKGKRSSSSPALKVAAPTEGDNIAARVIRFSFVAYTLFLAKHEWHRFYELAHQMARGISHPTIIQKGRTNTGEVVTVDDYRQAYFWLKHNTPEDARIMAWWDYGYQITGIGNRTTLADGNTWNHEHIALLGRTLTGSETQAHRIARHLADYVLIWAGGGGDDLAKSPHLRRIANSVYRGLCEEPTCRDFGFYSDGTPTENMEESLLYKLHGNGIRPGVEADRNRFKEVYRSKYGKVRIYKILKVSQESKEWILNNRECDVPGSWFCPGKYPPALEKILAEKKDFKQLEDFNVKREDDSEYQEQYFENLNKRHGPAADAAPKKGADGGGLTNDMTDAEKIAKMNSRWENNDVTTKFWELISENKVQEFLTLISQNPLLAHVRSQDGRGPMWWAYEYDRQEMIKILKGARVRDTLQDANGVTPKELRKK